MRLFFRFILIFGFFLTMVSCEKNSLQWNLPKAPVISAVSIIDITSTQLRVSAECTDDGYDRSVVKGFCWAFTPNPDTLSNTIKIVEPGEGIFESNIDWTSTQSIYVRAFAFNETAIAYSEQVKVEWPGGTQNNCLVNTLQATNIDFNSATVSGLVLNDGGLPLLSTGICVSSANSMPNLSNSIVLTSQNAAVSFSMNIFSLSDSTRYYFRAFATNFADTCYGPVREFTTRNYYPLGSQGPGGGLVFFIKNDTLDGWQFLEAAPADLVGVMSWSNGYLSSTGTSNTALGVGLSNTLAIVNQVGGFSNYAASGSLSYSNGSVSDWFLPSRDELMKLRDASSFGSLSQFGLANNYYWSSSEDLSSPNANAWCVHMQLTSGNMVLTNPKNSLFKVRPIRRFK